MKTVITTCLLASLSPLFGQGKYTSIEKNEMEVQWYHENDSIHFDMTAPTLGWVTIGFSETNAITGAYLLMGRVLQNQAEVVEHATLGPGNYKSITSLDNTTLVKNVSGFETTDATSLSFSVEVSSQGAYQKDLSDGKSYWMILAYSRDDDFNHHSIMRTSLRIKL